MLSQSQANSEPIRSIMVQMRGQLMRIATVSISGERRVGLVDPASGTFSAFDLSLEAAARGVVALIDRSTLPAILSPIALERATLEAPIHRPSRNIFCVGKNYHEHAHEFSRSGFDSSAAAGAVPKHPIIFSKVPETVIPNGAKGLINKTAS